MKKMALISIIALTFGPSAAHAAGINLSWTDCGIFGTLNRTFACASNAGSNTLVVSYEPNAVMSNMVGNDVRIDLQSADATTLNNWWQLFNAGSCRSTQPTINVLFPGGNCADFWNAGGSGGIGS